MFYFSSGKEIFNFTVKAVTLQHKALPFYIFAITVLVGAFAVFLGNGAIFSALVVIPVAFFGVWELDFIKGDKSYNMEFLFIRSCLVIGVVLATADPLNLLS